MVSSSLTTAGKMSSYTFPQSSAPVWLRPNEGDKIAYDIEQDRQGRSAATNLRNE